MRKEKSKKVSNKKSLREIIGIIYFIICIGVFAYAIIGVPILLMVLKKNGTQTEAVITSDTSSWLHRWTTSCYMYEFYVGSKSYEGNSLIKEGESSKIGTKIQILYLDWLPWFNRPVYYWDD